MRYSDVVYRVDNLDSDPVSSAHPLQSGIATPADDDWLDGPGLVIALKQVSSGNRLSNHWTVEAALDFYDLHVTVLDNVSEL